MDLPGRAPTSFFTQNHCKLLWHWWTTDHRRPVLLTPTPPPRPEGATHLFCTMNMVLYNSTMSLRLYCPICSPSLQQEPARSPLPSAGTCSAGTSSPHPGTLPESGTFSRIDHMLGQKLSLNKLEIEIIPQWHETTNQKIPEKTEKHTNTQRLKTCYYTMMGLILRSGRKARYFESNEIENTMIQHLWDTARTVLRWKFTAIQA